MATSTFHQKLEALDHQLLMMGTLCEESIALSMRALENSPLSPNWDGLDARQQVEQMERQIEEQCLKLLLRHQPVAKDLRRISSALKIVYDMKRIGTQSAEIADIMSQHKVRDQHILQALQSMAGLTIEMVTESIDAFVKENVNLAQKVMQKDDKLDQHFDTIKTELIAYFSHQTETVEQVIDGLMIAKYLERIGDHTVNIARWVLFSITGQQVEN